MIKLRRIQHEKGAYSLMIPLPWWRRFVGRAHQLVAVRPSVDGWSLTLIPARKRRQVAGVMQGLELGRAAGRACR